MKYKKIYEELENHFFYNDLDPPSNFKDMSNTIMQISNTLNEPDYNLNKIKQHRQVREIIRKLPYQDQVLICYYFFPEKLKYNGKYNKFDNIVQYTTNLTHIELIELEDKEKIRNIKYQSLILLQNALKKYRDEKIILQLEEKCQKKKKEMSGSIHN